MVWRFAVGVALIGAFIADGSARAADLAVKAPALPPPAATYNWTGFYIGGNGGYAFDPTTVTFSPSGFATIVLAPLGGFVATGGTPSFDLTTHPQGGLGGVQAGYNWQRGAWVYGLEADFDWAHLNGSTAAPFAVVGTNFGDAANIAGNLQAVQKIDYFGTARARLGWANDTLLLYVTGGAGWAHIKTTLDTFGISTFGLIPAQIATLTVSSSSSTLRAGFAVGGGFEWAAAANLSLRAEYLLIDISNATSLSFPAATVSSNIVPIQVARVGFSYLFH